MPGQVCKSQATSMPCTPSRLSVGVLGQRGAADPPEASAPVHPLTPHSVLRDIVLVPVSHDAADADEILAYAAGLASKSVLTWSPSEPGPGSRRRTHRIGQQ
jgi:hypothetical protein